MACAKDILSKGIAELKPLFQAHFPGAAYSSQKAVRRLMQLPVAIVMLQLKGPGSQKLFATQLSPNVDYCLLAEWMAKLKVGDNTEMYLSKETLQCVCSLTSTEKDRKLIKFVACQSNGMSNKKASQEYGVSNFSGIKKDVEDAMKDAIEIRDAVLELASIKEKATLESFGIYVEQDCESSSDDESPEHSDEVHIDMDDTTMEESGESSDSDEDENEVDINKEVEIVRSGNGNSCGPGIGSGKFDGRTDNTGRSSLQSLRCGEVEGQKSLPVPGSSSKKKTVINAAPTNDHLVSIL